MNPSTKLKPDAKLDELAAMKAERAAKLKVPTKPPPTPPILTLKLNLVDLEGEEHTCELIVRIFNRDETLEVHRLAALYSGIDFDMLSSYAKEICLARAMVEVMWKNEVPEWLKVAMAQDEGVSLQIANAINSHRTAWFRGDYREGAEGKKSPGLVIVPVSPATSRAE